MAMRKYGLEAFRFEVLEYCGIDELDEREIYWIHEYGSNRQGVGYNLTMGGEHPVQSIPQEELDEITDLLVNHPELTQQDIADRVGKCRTIIQRINLGVTWYRDWLTYPLRPKHCRYADKAKTEERHRMNPPKWLCSTCKVCGGMCSKNSEYCRKCSNELKAERMGIKKPDKDTLWNEVKGQTLGAVADKYRVTDSAIRK